LESKFSRPESLEVHISEGDVFTGWKTVYFAEEMDKWLGLIETYLKSAAYDPLIVQHGNVAQRLLKIFFRPRPYKGV